MPCLSRRCHLFARAPPLGKHPDGVAPRIMARSGKQIGKRGDSPGRNHGEPARKRLNLRGRDRYAIGDVERGCSALEKGGAALARFTQRDRPIAEQGAEHPRKSGPCRSEEHPSELTSLLSTSSAVVCLK